jgi:hypothetical protein
MADFGKLGHAGDEFIVVDQDTSRLTAFAAAGTFDNQQAGAAFCAFGVIIQLLFGYISVMSGVVSAAGGKNNPVFQFDFAHFPGLKKFGKFRHAFSPSAIIYLCKINVWTFLDSIRGRSNTFLQ